jgi:hypothetical protein
VDRAAGSTPGGGAAVMAVLELPAYRKGTCFAAGRG